MSKTLRRTICVLLVLQCLFMSIRTASIGVSTVKTQQMVTTRKSSASPITAPYTLVSNGQGSVYEWQSDTITVRLTGAQTQGLFTLTEDAMKPTFKLGLHLHRKHAETFHILDGEVEFRVGSERRVVRAGTTIHVPANTPHAAQVINGRQARMLMLYAPAGFEHFLREMKTFSDAQFADEKFMKAFNERYDNIVLE